jgi:hypothetical protein
MPAFLLGALAAVAVGALIGWVMGAAIAYTGAHPILVSLSMMIFLRGLGEFATRGGDISGFPQFVGMLGHGWFAGIPAPLWTLIACVALWHLILNKTRLGLTIYMAGSNIEATRYSGIDTKRTIMLVYTLSGLMCGIAGILMLARFNSVRVGHGEAYLLITVLACFLGRVDPADPPGDLVGAEPAGSQPASRDRHVGRLPDRRHGRPPCLGRTVRPADLTLTFTQHQEDVFYRGDSPCKVLAFTPASGRSTGRGRLPNWRSRKRRATASPSSR